VGGKIIEANMDRNGKCTFYMEKIINIILIMSKIEKKRIIAFSSLFWICLLKTSDLAEQLHANNLMIFFCPSLEELRLDDKLSILFSKLLSIIFKYSIFVILSKKSKFTVCSKFGKWLISDDGEVIFGQIISL
jgi:hypothetical protein